MGPLSRRPLQQLLLLFVLLQHGAATPDAGVVEESETVPPLSMLVKPTDPQPALDESPLNHDTMTAADVTSASTAEEAPTTTTTTTTTSTTEATTTVAATTTPTDVDSTTPTSPSQPVPSSGTAGNVTVAWTSPANRRIKPADCSQFTASPVQPIYNARARLRKCCPSGQLFGGSNDRYRCEKGAKFELPVETIEATFYGKDECIEAGNMQLASFAVEVRDSCEDFPEPFLYSADQGDAFYILQNGSLLVVENGTLFSIFDDYCVDMTTTNGLLAKVCYVTLHSILTLPMIFIPLTTISLIAIVVSYSLIRKKNVFDKLILLYAGSLGIGTVLYRIHLYLGPAHVGWAKTCSHVFFVSSAFWFLVMTVYNCSNFAYYIPRGLEYNAIRKPHLLAVTMTLGLATIGVLFIPWPHMFMLVVGIISVATALVQLFSLYSKWRLSTGGQQELRSNYYRRICREFQLCCCVALVSIACWTILAYAKIDRSRSQQFTQLIITTVIVFQGLLISAFFFYHCCKWRRATDPSEFNAEELDTFTTRLAAEQLTVESTVLK